VPSAAQSIWQRFAVKQVSIVLVAALVGVTVGLGFYTFVYARGYAYLTNNPQACANCHVMQEYYDAWIKSPHRAVAACNDCHTPHNFAGKYATKVENGFFHSLAFTSGRFPDNIFIRPRDERVTESTCRSCHEQITTAIAGPHNSNTISCIRCHFDVGHSAASYVIGSPEASSLESNLNGEQH
jgi:cytochrome c nitrite reductase small subunit